ncbi:MAG: diacylglycerol kinase [Zoogloeaceae bacterium]|nr:diacylglycerol kinase [Rhodocyclaceae bacterium]MCP5236764.1 diacylglycerol kinase [Zoogloeaceae bacterium]
MTQDDQGRYKHNDGAARILRAFGYSREGLYAAFSNEAAFRQEIFTCIVLAPLALWLGDTGTERALMLGSLLLVLIVELLNSAIEAIVDRVSMAPHPLSKRAKDIGSAAVLVAIANACVVWVVLLTGG